LIRRKKPEKTQRERPGSAVNYNTRHKKVPLKFTGGVHTKYISRSQKKKKLRELKVEHFRLVEQGGGKLWEGMDLSVARKIREKSPGRVVAAD